MSCSLNIDNLTIKRDKRVLCTNISLDVSHKEKIAIIGQNGCGKTTFLDTIIGLNKIEQGSIKLFHKDINNIDDFKTVRSMIGYLLQDSDNQFLAPIVEDDIAFGLLSRGVCKEEARDKTLVLLERFGISQLAKKVVYHLSGGEKKIVALAGVLITEPKLILLDEPTSGLDFDMQLRLVDILSGIDKSIVIVSHNKEFIDSVVKKVYRITPSGLELVTSGEYVHSHDGLPAHTHPHEHDF